MRNCTTKIKFDVFRNDVFIYRYILHHCKQHKIVNQNFLVDRVSSFPLNSGKFEKQSNIEKVVVTEIEEIMFSNPIIEEIRRTKLRA